MIGHDWINQWNRRSVQYFGNHLIKFKKHNLPGLVYDIIILFCINIVYYSRRLKTRTFKGVLISRQS